MCDHIDLLLQRFALKSRVFSAGNLCIQQVVGAPPGDYLNQWRITLAQSLLSRGKPLGLIADEVGYGSATALTRAFTSRVGQSPTAWLATRGQQ